MSKKEGKIGIRRTFSLRVSASVCELSLLVSEWMREASDKGGTWEAERSASDAGRREQAQTEVLLI